MARIYRDDDVDVTILKQHTIGIIGYGNQGRAQALNIRDSGFGPMVANRDDGYRQQAIEDGFAVYPISRVAEEADIVLLLIPDEVQPQVYQEQIQPHLRSGDILCFASGYNVHYGAIEPPRGVGAIMRERQRRPVLGDRAGAGESHRGDPVRRVRILLPRRDGD